MLFATQPDFDRRIQKTLENSARLKALDTKPSKQLYQHLECAIGLSVTANDRNDHRAETITREEPDSFTFDLSTESSRPQGVLEEFSEFFTSTSNLSQNSKFLDHCDRLSKGYPTQSAPEVKDTSICQPTGKRSQRKDIEEKDATEFTGKKRRIKSCQEDLDKDISTQMPKHSKTSHAQQPDTSASFKSALALYNKDNQQRFGKQSDEYKAPFLKRKAGGNDFKGRLPAAPGPRTGNKTDASGSLSARTIELLSQSSGEIPESLFNFDQDLLETVCSEILDKGSNLQWNDIAGQTEAKKSVQEMVVWPMLNPQLFQGPRAPPRGLLLFGPPGTGKTLIGKAIASNIKATFFSISAGSLTSKWIGDGEKMVRILFAVAEVLQPTVIFIDEIDSILSVRKSDGEHEASRRIKTELLVQMDGCNPNSLDARILIIGATNRPQELDEAARRRLPKQLYIPLPCAEARRQMVYNLLKSVKYKLTEAEISKIVEKTEGYSGSDMKILIQEACQGPVRELFNQNIDISAISEEDLRPIGIRDFQAAARRQKPSVDPSEIEHYVAYNEKHGAKAVDDQIDEDDSW